jgi:hypothetical protein
MHTKFWLENLKGRDKTEDLGIHGKIISEQIFGNREGRYGVDSSAKDRDQWQALMNTVMWLLASQEGLCSIELVTSPVNLLINIE